MNNQEKLLAVLSTKLDCIIETQQILAGIVLGSHDEEARSYVAEKLRGVLEESQRRLEALHISEENNGA